MLPPAAATTYVAEAEIAADLPDGEQIKALSPDLAPAGVIPRGGKIAFLPLFSCKRAVGELEVDECNSMLARLERQGREAGYWVVPASELGEPSQALERARKADVDYVFAIDEVDYAFIQSATSLRKVTLRVSPKLGEVRPYEPEEPKPIVDRCRNLFDSTVAGASESVWSLSVRLRLLSVVDERVLWTYARTLSESVEQPEGLVRYHEFADHDRRSFLRKISWSLAGGALASFVVAAATAGQKRPIPVSFALTGAALGAASGWSWWQMRHIEQAPVIDPRQGICRALYASSVDSREKPAPPTGEYMLADQAKGDDGVEEEIDVDTLSLARQAGLRQSLAQELFRKIEALEQKTWSLPASSDTKHHHNNHEPSTDGAATEIEEKWPWLMPGTVCQIVHGGPKGCRVQLVCEATWSRCIPMQEYETPVRHMDDVSWGPTQRTDMTTTSEPLQPVPAEVVQEVVPVQSEPLPTTTAANSDAAVESPAAVDADKSKAPVESNELPGQHAVQAPTGEIEKPAQETVEK